MDVEGVGSISGISRGEETDVFPLGQRVVVHFSGVELQMVGGSQFLAFSESEVGHVRGRLVELSSVPEGLLQVFSRLIGRGCKAVYFAKHFDGGATLVYVTDEVAFPQLSDVRQVLSEGDAGAAPITFSTMLPPGVRKTV